MDGETLEALKKCPNSPVAFDYVGRLFPLVYGIPTIVLTIILIATILRNNSLKHVFFYQFVVFGTGNSLYWLSSVLMDKILLLPILCPTFVEWFSKPTIFLKLIYLIYCYAIENYFFCAFAIYSWRVYTIVRFSSSTGVGLRKRLRLMLLIQLVVPFSMFWLFVNTTVSYGFIQSGTPRIMFLYSGWPYLDASVVSGIMFGCLSLLIIVSSALMVYKICQIRQREDSRAERNVMITCLTFGISAASISLYQSAIFYFNIFAPNPTVYNLILSYRGNKFIFKDTLSSLGYVIDVAALLPTWCLLLTSSKVRRKVLHRKQTVLLVGSITRNSA